MSQLTVLKVSETMSYLKTDTGWGKVEKNKLLKKSKGKLVCFS